MDFFKKWSSVERGNEESAKTVIQEREQGSDEWGDTEPATLVAQKATEHHPEMRMGYEPPSPMTTTTPSGIETAIRPPEGRHREPRQSDKRLVTTKRNPTTKSREASFADRDARFADSKNKKIAQLENYISQLRERHARELGELRAQVVQNQQEKQECAAKLIEVCKERDRFAKDNVTLRERNLAMRSPHGQYPDDENYIQRIKNLNESMKIWVKNAFKSNEPPKLSDEEDEEILRVLSKEETLESILIMPFSKDSLRSIYSNSPYRIMLVRHLISLYVWKYIFLSFCFGFHSTTDRLMIDVFKSILTKG